MKYLKLLILSSIIIINLGFKEHSETEELKFVTAKSGLVYRDKPKGKRLGKFDFKQQIIITEHTDIFQKIKNGDEFILSEWLGVKVGQKTVYVFGGFLSDVRIHTNVKLFIKNITNKNKIKTGTIKLKESDLSSNPHTEYLVIPTISNDSIQILDYAQRGNPLEDNCTIIDYSDVYKNNVPLVDNTEKYVPFYMDQNTNKSLGIDIYKTNKDKNIKNPYNILENEYIFLNSYKNHPITYSENMGYPIYLTDSQIAFTYMDGIQTSYFSKIEKTKKGTFIFHLDNKQFYEIRIIDEKSMIQIWKNENNEYILLVPTRNNLPLLDEIYSEYDYSTISFDKMNLEEMFNSDKY